MRRDDEIETVSRRAGPERRRLFTLASQRFQARGTGAATTELFVVKTPIERWALGDPLPTEAIPVGGTSVSLEERGATVTSMEASTVIRFPVSGYAAYRSSGTPCHFVFVEYTQGVATSITIEYLPNHLSLPTAAFKPAGDGTFYATVATSRKDGRVYVRQVVSDGQDDGKGGLWVEREVIYSAPSP